MLAVAPRPGPDPGQHQLSRQATDHPEKAIQKPRILLVEDDYFVALEVEHYLRASGFDVVGTATTAEEAIRQAEAERPELAVMDIRLAGVRDGIDAAIELFTKYGIRSIFASAHVDPETRKRAQAANPAGWLSKPYMPESLVELLKAVTR
jgi:two-component system, response regulator PdtaR